MKKRVCRLVGVSLAILSYLFLFIFSFIIFKNLKPVGLNAILIISMIVYLGMVVLGILNYFKNKRKLLFFFLSFHLLITIFLIVLLFIEFSVEHASVVAANIISLILIFSANY